MLRALPADQKKILVWPLQELGDHWDEQSWSKECWLGGEQVKKKLPYRTTQYFWTLHCKQCGILHTIWRIAHYLLYCTLHSTEHCNITGELTPAKITTHSCSLTTYKIYLVVAEVYTILHTIWHTAHYMAYCTLNGVLHTAQHTIHCTPQHNLRLDPSKNKSTLL